MLPNVRFLGVDLYYIMICVGILAALICFRVFCDKKRLPTKPFNFFLIIAVVSIACGFGFATLFQSLYNYIATGVWEWNGMTFLGGLIGSVVCFLAFYFAIGHFIFKKKEHITHFYSFLCCAIPCIVVAHALGRFGCLFAGCCYGIPSEKFGLPMQIDGVYEKRVPTQLFEALFLLVLFAVLVFLLLKKNNRYTAQIYLISYGVWRFCIEYLRDDPRGSMGIPFLTPSQLTSILMAILGVALIFVYRYVIKKLKERAESSEKTE